MSMSATSLLSPRYRVGRGHVESWFLRANHLTERRAIWLKATIRAPIGGGPVAEAWCIVFGQRTRAWHARVPLAQCTFEGDPLRINVGGCKSIFGAQGGSTSGSIPGPEGDVSWDLDWKRMPGDLGAPLVPYPHPALLKGPFPRSKLTTPLPAARFDGTIVVDGVPLTIDAWSGMNGHNWGREHPLSYAWGQCLFPSASTKLPEAMVEAFSGRVRVAGKESPLISAMIIRMGSRTWHFDRLFDLWRQEAAPDSKALSWSLGMRSHGATARLQMRARAEEMAALAYWNPDNRLSTCLNSKLAEVRLEVSPRDEPAMTWESAHGGALEFLFQGTDPRFPRPVGGEG